MDQEGQAGVQRVMEDVADRIDLFAQRWRDALTGCQAIPLRVVEFACGSANDYRYFVEYGLAQFLDYTGRIDLSEKNVANAKRRFPDTDFRVGSILSLPEKRRSVDYVIGYDILEHLSLQGMFTALKTAERIARRGLYFAFSEWTRFPSTRSIPVAATTTTCSASTGCVSTWTAGTPRCSSSTSPGCLRMSMTTDGLTTTTGARTP